MKLFAFIMLFLLLVPTSPAQTIATPGAKTMTFSGTNLVVAGFDTVACGQRYAARMGLQFTAADTIGVYQRARASVVCPPTGYTPADSARFVLQGINTPFDSLFVTHPNGITYKFKRTP
jgi:hypothetical protein